MRLERMGLWLGVAGASYAVLAFAGCSGSSSGGTPDTTDATAQDSPSDDAAPVEDAPSQPIVEASADTGVDAAPDGGLDAAVDASDGSVLDGSSEGGSDAAAACIPVDAGVPDDAAVSAGLGYTTSFTPNCSTCHRPDFSGGVAVGGATSKNLTPDPVTGLGCWTDAQIVTAILYGTTPDGTTLCVMPKWSTKGMTNDQAEAIVHYLRTLPAVSRVVAASACEIAADAGTTASDGGDAGDGG
jgi:mono/diheme cytochrome c family protein